MREPIAPSPGAAAGHKWLPEIRRDDCTGCGLCVTKCDRQCLELVWDFATLTRPADCGSCGECASACPTGVIEMRWLALTADPNVGRWCVEPPVSAEVSGGSNWWQRLWLRKS